jgi:hypothetical protein
MMSAHTTTTTGVAQAHRYCVKCCCVPGQSLIKRIVYKKSRVNCSKRYITYLTYFLLIYLEGGEHEEESYVDYASVMDQMETRITVRYGNSIMEEGEAFVAGKN